MVEIVLDFVLVYIIGLLSGSIVTYMIINHCYTD